MKVNEIILIALVSSSGSGCKDQPTERIVNKYSRNKASEVSGQLPTSKPENVSPAGSQTPAIPAAPSPVTTGTSGASPSPAPIPASKNQAPGALQPASDSLRYFSQSDSDTGVCYDVRVDKGAETVAENIGKSKTGSCPDQIMIGDDQFEVLLTCPFRRDDTRKLIVSARLFPKGALEGVDYSLTAEDAAAMCKRWAEGSTLK